MNKFYITTTLPYVNADPHVGFALELIQADVIARYHRLLGDEVVFNTGTDEHGLKIYRNAIEAGKEPQAYTDEYATQFADLTKVLSVSTTHFIRTTDLHHKKTAQEFWKRCFENGDIYKKSYKIKYCVGCELEKTDSELVEGRCPIHPNLELEVIDEENYFFRFSKYQEPLLKLYEERPDFVLPNFRFNEIKSFVQQGLNDFSVSRLKSKMPWGVPVLGDDEQVMYVWFDALTNYISTLGWPEDGKTFSDFWPGSQIAGKDNLRQQSAIWQAMLLSAGLSPSKQILIHGFVTAEGQKMSKSLGNVINPFDVVKRYGTDVLRYYLLREIPSGEDGDFSYKNLEARYNSDLANGLGNLVQRVATLIINQLDSQLIYESDKQQATRPNDYSVGQASNKSDTEYTRAIEEFRLHDALAEIWKLIGEANVFVNERKPWAEAKENPEQFIATMTTLVAMIHHITWLLQPFLPETAQKIAGVVGDDLMNKEIPENYHFKVTKGEGLFPRL